MRSLAWALLVCGSLLAFPVHATGKHVIDVSTPEQLLEALREPADGTTVRLAPGVYRLPGMQYSVRVWECRGVVRENYTTVGVVVSGRDIVLQGSRDGESEISTDANVGILFDHCHDCRIERAVVSGHNPGERGKDSALVASRGSSVQVRDCVLQTDVTDASWVTGLASTGRSDVRIESSEIAGVGCGVTLSDSATAAVMNTLVSRSSAVDGGPCIRVDCEASATLRRNHLRGFTDGVRVSGSSSLVCEKNIIENMSQNGITALGDKTGRLRIENNVFYRCGWAGIAVCANGDQRASGNMIVATGIVHPQQSAVYVIGARSDAAVRKNTLYDNTVIDESLDRDVPREIFWRVRRPWTRTYRNTPVGVDGRHHFYESAFLTRYGRWAN